MPKYYLSGSSLDYGKMRIHFDRFSKIIDIVYKWIEHSKVRMEKESYNNVSNIIIQKIKECDILLAMMDSPSRNYRGVFSEIGMALAFGKKVIIFNPSDNPVFNFMASDRIETSLHYHNENIIVFKNMDELIKYINEENTLEDKERTFIIE